MIKLYVPNQWSIKNDDPWYFSPQMKAYISKHYIFPNNNKANVSRLKRSILN